MNLKLVVFAGPPTSGKTSVIKQVIKKLKEKDLSVSFLKIDVLFADEDEIIKNEFDIPVKKVYSKELCPDHCNVLILGDAIEWAKENRSDILIVETAGLCLRCSPYITDSLGIAVLEATSGMNLPKKIGPMLTLSDIAVVTKIDLVSQAEREVFRYQINKTAKDVSVIEVNALYGIGIDKIIKRILKTPELKEGDKYLRGTTPVGTCTLCIGKKQIGSFGHYGVLRTLDSDLFYKGE